MNLRKFYTNKTLWFLVVLLAIFLGAYLLKDKNASTIAPVVEEKQIELIPISITSKEIEEENFTGTIIEVSGSALIVKKTQDFIQQTISQFRDQANAEVPDMRAEFGVDSPSANYAIEIRASLVESEKTESIVISVYAYTGGAHGNSAYKVLTASKEDGKILALSDIIKSDKQATFAEFIKKELKSWAPNGSVAPVVFPEEVDSLRFESFENWSLDGKNLILYFSQYEIGPGVLGPIMFPVSITKIKDFLK